jgi:glyoxalase family protein
MGPALSVTRDEPGTRLGETLILPPWLEPQRDQIERALPPLRTPAGVAS